MVDIVGVRRVDAHRAIHGVGFDTRRVTAVEHDGNCVGLPWQPLNALDIVRAVGHIRLDVQLGQRLSSPQIGIRRSHRFAVANERRTHERSHAPRIKNDAPMPGFGKLSSKVGAIRDIDLELVPRPKGVVRYCIVGARGETRDREADAREQE